MTGTTVTMLHVMRTESTEAGRHAVWAVVVYPTTVGAVRGLQGLVSDRWLVGLVSGAYGVLNSLSMQTTPAYVSYQTQN